MHINEEAGNHYESRNQLKGAASPQAPGVALSFPGKLVWQKPSTASSRFFLPSSHVALSALKFVLHSAE